MAMPLHYTFTNENLAAIMEGLNVTEGDRILAVGASGDQAFAMLEVADKVGVIDTNPTQLEFIYRRAVLLAAKDYDEFLRSSEEGMCDEVFDWSHVGGRPNQEYFLEPGRLRRIRSRLGGLEFHKPRNIMGLGPFIQGYNKIYLSNANIAQKGYQHLRLGALSAELPMWGLIYFADNGELNSRTTPQARLFSHGLVLEDRLSRIAQAREKEAGNIWTPEVLKKVLPFENLPFVPSI